MSKNAGEPSWVFHKFRAGQANVDGNITKLFNTGDSRPPKAFSDLIDRQDEKAVSAVIYGREGIANCVDASHAAQTGKGDLTLDFLFEEFKGSEANSYWDLLRLDDLASRSNNPLVNRQGQLGLGTEDCLTKGRKAPLRILTTIERGGGGMPGALADEDSVLVRALMNIGEAQTRSGAAGSYGYGKAAVAQASKPRIVIVYTCTSQQNSTDGVTRRLMGVTYWGMHKLNETRFTGWGIFGRETAGDVEALEDEEADIFAEKLGLLTRDPHVTADQGTTFMILDPVFDAVQLKGAVEVFWWPLLQQTRDIKLNINISDINNELLTINVDPSHKELGQFISRFRDAESARKDLRNTVEEKRVVQCAEAGITALSVKEPDSIVDGSMVALMRSPLMVVAYEKVEHAFPPVVGVFVSHDKTNENLRKVEPPEHDKWLRQKVGGLIATTSDIKISRLAREERINAANLLRAPDPEPVYGITAFSSHFPAIDSGVAKPRPPKPVKEQRKQRLVHVHLVHQANSEATVERPTREYLQNGNLQARAFVRFSLDKDRAKKLQIEFLDATIKIGAKIDEDGGSGEWYPSTVSQVGVQRGKKFERISSSSVNPALFRGRFRIGESIYFEIATEPYDSNWSIELIFDCDPWDSVEPIQALELGD
jgi:hypothetical protein